MQTDTFNHILQTDSTSCGFISAKMICSYFGIEMTESKRDEENALFPISMLEVSQILENHNLKTLGARLSINELMYIDLPAILHWNGNHFVVLYKIDSNWAYISDPAVGAQCYRLDEFSHWFTTSKREDKVHSSSIDKWSNKPKWGIVNIVDFEKKGNCLLIKR